MFARAQNTSCHLENRRTQRSVNYAESPKLFFANCLYRAMKGAGTDDRALIRIIVSRSEIDLVDIKKAYNELFSRSLLEDVKVYELI